MFRISNDVQRSQTISKVEGFKKQRDAIEKTKGKRVADSYWKNMLSLVNQLEAQVDKYDRLRREGLLPFRGLDFESLGSYLVDARIAFGMTQKELAKKLNVSQPMIYKYEAAEYEGFGLDLIHKILNAFNIKINLDIYPKKLKQKYDALKQKNAVLYFLNNVNNVFLAKTKLMKLLYYVDFEFYAKEKRSITGDFYLAKQYGPVPEHAELLLKKMIEEGTIVSERLMLGEYEQTKYFPKREANMTVFDHKEREKIENVARRFEHWSAKQMSDLTHEEHPWQVTSIGQRIDYQLVSSITIKGE